MANFIPEDGLIPEDNILEFYPEGESLALARFDLSDFMGEEEVQPEDLEQQNFPDDDIPEDDIPEDVMASSTPEGGEGGAHIGNSLWKANLKEKEVDLLSHDDLAAFVRSTKNANTIKKTVQVVTAFKKYLQKQCLENRPIEEIGPQELDSFLSNYLLWKKKSNGEEHQPDTLTSIHRGILRYLKEREYPVDPLHHDSFEMSREVLASKRIKLKGLGYGNRPNRAESLDEEQIEKLWETGALGRKTPRSLQHTVYFLTNLCFGTRGSHESQQMCWGDVDLLQDDKGIAYLEFHEKISKTRNGAQGGEVRAFPPKLFAIETERCPVYFYKMFASKRPIEMMEPTSPFFLTVKQGTTMDDDVCYTCTGMGVNTRNGIVKKMCQEAEVDGRHTNHSIRKSMVQKLMAENVPPVLVAQLSGHKCLASLNNYSLATRPQQKAMCNILTGGKRANAPTSALGAPPSKIPAVTEPAMLFPPGPALPAVAPVNVNPGGLLPGLSENIGGMFAGAVVNGGITLNINYNVSSNTQSNLNMSPLLPKPAVDD